MDLRRFASAAAVVGAVGWLTKVALIWANGGQNTDTGLVAVAFFVGLVGLVVAAGAAGYVLVETAPVWLRVVVVVATVLLLMILGQMTDVAIKAVYTTEGWLRGELNIILTGVVALVLGVWGLTRRRSEGERGRPKGSPTRPAHGRRAAR